MLRLGLSLSQSRNRNSLPQDDLVAAFLIANDLQDTIGLLITPDQIREELRPIFFDGETRRSDAAIVSLIEASEYLNNGWELVGSESKGYAVYAEGTSETILRKAYRYFGFALPVTRAFTAATLDQGFVGYFDETSTSGRKKFAATYSHFSAYLSGSSAKMRFGGNETAFFISVDFGTPSQPTLVDGEVVLFEELTDEPHFVDIYCWNAAAGNGAYVYTTGDFITITGVLPKVTFIGETAIPTDPDFKGLDTHFQRTTTIGATYLPVFPPAHYGAAANGYSNSGATRFKARCSEIWVCTGDSEVWIGVDSEHPVKHALGTADSTYVHWYKLTGFDGTTQHTYTVVGSANGGSFMAVGVDSEIDEYAGTETVVFQIGDSITRGDSNTGQYHGSVDTYKYCTALGKMPGAAGRSGVSIQGLTTDIATFLPLAPAFDVVVLAIGRNNITDTEGDFKTYYAACINALIAADVQKIVCRGITPGPFATQNSWISAVVSTFADANIIYVSPDAWTGIEAIGAHPTEAGYVTMADYEVVDLDGLLDLSADTAWTDRNLFNDETLFTD